MEKFKSVPKDGQTDIYSNCVAFGLGDWYTSPNIIHIIKSNHEMGATHGMYRKEQKFIQRCGGET